MMRYIKFENLDLFLKNASKVRKVYVPVDTATGRSEYKEWHENIVISKSLHTTRSAKDFFFPQTENLVKFKMDHKKIEIIDPRREIEDFAIFGVRACDAKSFKILDSVFLSDPVDTYYKNRRERGLIISMACERPAETCFCKAFEIDASSPAGDVVFIPVSNGYAVDSGTARGEEFLRSLGDIFDITDEKCVDEAKDNIRAKIEKLPLSYLDTSKFGANKTDKFFNDERWEQLSESCIACGTCTFVCPTCQCYDIRDFDCGSEICRFRCWDSCMYSDFTKMAHGNPRLTQKERFRQRFMHKLVYYPENNNGVYGCVGCGRCLVSCPISMNIVKVMKKLAEEEKGND